MKLTVTALSAAALAATAVLSVPTAGADDSVILTFGRQAEFVNAPVVQGWRVSDLRPSSDVIPYPVAGTLWEATATDTALQGTVTPVVPDFNARAHNGQTYRVLWQVATPQGVSPATLAQGQQTTGKLYFDVVGAAPDSVVYNDGGRDLATWVAPPPAPSGSPSNGNSAGTAGTAAPAAAMPAETAPAESQPGAPAAPEGSQGTPITEGSQGTPITEGGTGAAGTPTGTQQPPVQGSQGTPAATATSTPPS